MDVLLSHSYFLAEDPHERRIMKPYAPLGLLYVSAYLKREGFDVAVQDTTFAQRADVHARLAAREAPVLGLYTNLTTRASVLDLTRAAKASGWTVVHGGPESANWPEAYLAHGADVVVIGEGERTMAELLGALARAGKHRLHDVAGIVFVDEEGRVVRTPPRPLIADLDALPWPDRDAIDMAAYLACWREHHGVGSLNMICARGCAYRCRWCSHSVFGHHHARRSPQDVAAELAHVVERWRPDMLWYADDVFTIHPRWLAEYAAELDARGLRVPFECITRADRLSSASVEALRTMGAFRVWIGGESGSQAVLDAMERGVKVEQVRAAVEALKAAGVAVGMFLMWGYDGETTADIEATVDLVRRADPDVFLTTVAYPIKGTPYYDAVAGRVVAPADWAAGSDRDHRVRGRPGPRYYRFATRRLRHAVALDRLRRDRPRAIGAIARAWLGAEWSRLGLRLTDRPIRLPAGRPAAPRP